MRLFAKNLKYLRQKHGLEQIDLAHQLGRKSASSISEWESGRYTPKLKVLSEIAQIFKVNIDDMMNIDLSVEPDNVIEVESIENIPLMGNIACGNPILSEENIENYISFPTELLPSSGKVFFVKAQGDSMVPLIKDESLVLIRKQDVVENGEIAAVLLNGNGEVTLKKIRKINKSVLLTPINDHYDPIMVNKDNPAKILGKAVKVINDI